MASGFAGKLFAITGGGSGIGLATAKRLVSHGAVVSLADINTAALGAAATTLAAIHASHSTPAQSPVLTTTLDVAHPDPVKNWITKTTTHFARPLSGAINMAGTIGPSNARETGTIRRLPDAEFHALMTTHVTGTWNSLRAELPALVSGRDGLGGGSIVNAASIASRMGFARNPAYTTAKHAIAGLTRAAAMDEGERGIRVNAIAPGFVDTPMVRGLAEGQRAVYGAPGPMKRYATSDEVASLVCYLLGEEAGFVNGAVVQIDGGWNC